MAVESAIGKQIREVLATSLRRDPSSIKPEHSLRDDLGLDSLMTFELLYDLEKAFDMEIPNDDLPGLQTLDDVVKYVEGRVNPNNSTATSKFKEKKPSDAKPTKTSKTTLASKPKPKATTKTKKPSVSPKSRPTTSPTKARATTPKTKRVASTQSSKKSSSSAKTKAKKK
ncbi:acyl carrier protein [Candidatus Nitronereus thalassa]|uniref:Acyl carrier protein n=1 Tax=Candidatus Nitronereus thalassa TaxID=3020898 RepID=A0ABU3K4H0_9BACT|nr:acyl carrier protein [Candidatus Nitronereus thalassa]MDT7041271.1 acyl carrier protein [Candidatus Nitronereus thalassa]